MGTAIDMTKGTAIGTAMGAAMGMAVGTAMDTAMVTAMGTAMSMAMGVSHEEVVKGTKLSVGMQHLEKVTSDRALTARLLLGRWMLGCASAP